MKPYRCVNPECSDDESGLPRFDFWSLEPRCPKCGADGRDKESRHLLIARAIIHLMPMGKWGKGTGKNACNGKRVGGQQATPMAQFVTCLDCRAAPAWKTAAVEQGFEVITEIDPERAEVLRAAAGQTLRRAGAVEKKGR